MQLSELTWTNRQTDKTYTLLRCLSIKRTKWNLDPGIDILIRTAFNIEIEQPLLKGLAGLLDLPQGRCTPLTTKTFHLDPYNGESLMTKGD